LKPSTPRPDSGPPGPGRLRNTGAPRVVSLLSDYGLKDGFVGALHSVLRSRLPQVPIVDLTHEVPPQDVRAGSLALQRAAPYLAEGVAVAIVDPGVGSARRAVAIRASETELTFIGPDNGLLLPAVDERGGAAAVVDLVNPVYQLASPGPTFAGRDIFAPAAAFLADGGHIGDLGRPVDAETLVRLPPPVCRRQNGWLEVEVTWIDRYGNVQLAGRPEALYAGGEGRRPVISVRRPVAGLLTARAVHTFGDLAPGELGLLVDSYGHLALCLNAASAAQFLGASERDVLSLK
jgi:S-adenosyl-L-methionine hydrolase (adenosine-forming)